MNIYPYMFTYGGPQLFVLFALLVVTPFVYRVFLRQRSIRTRIISVLGIWVAAVVVAYGDVFVIALEARRLCSEEAGMKVYRIAETKGFLGETDIRFWAQHGFEFVESDFFSPRHLYRYRLVNGGSKKEEVSTLLSEYELRNETVSLRLPINREREYIASRKYRQILGEVVSFSFYPGWMDRRVLGLLGFSWSPPRCDGDYPPRQQKRTIYSTDFIKAVLKPTQ